MEEIRTEPQSGGIAIGKAVLLKQPDLAAERREITAAEAEKEQAAFRRAAEQVRESLRPLARTNAIFAAHLDMAEDATLLQGVEEKIAAGKNAEWALEEETEELSGMLESLEDAYLRERAADVRDVCRRMMAALKESRRPPFGISPRRPFFLQRSSIPPIPLRWIFDTSEGW